jgi:hypothetical protein
MPSTNDPAATGIASQRATQLTLARTTLTTSSERMPRAAWRAYYNTVRRTAQELRESMAGRLTEEGMVIKRDFDATLRVIDLVGALEDIFEEYERVVRALYRRAIEYLASRIRVTLGLYHEDEQPEPQHEGREQFLDTERRWRSMKRSKVFLWRLVEDLKELKEQRPDVIMAKI